MFLLISCLSTSSKRCSTVATGFLTIVMLSDFMCYTEDLPNFYPVYLQHCSCKHVFSEWKTVWILIRWLHQKPADLDPQCFQKRINLGLSGQELTKKVSSKKGVLNIKQLRDLQLFLA